MKYLVVFNKQPGELINSYSLVDDVILATIPNEIIKAKKEVEDKLYSKEELEAIRETLI